MKTIHKYVLSDVQNAIWTNEGARFIHAGNQREQITVWVEVDTTRPFEHRTLYVTGTGNPLPEKPVDYVGSALMAGGNFVFHVYAERESEADHG